VLRSSGSGAVRDGVALRPGTGFDTRDVLVSLQIALAVVLLVVLSFVGWYKLLREVPQTIAGVPAH